MGVIVRTAGSAAAKMSLIYPFTKTWAVIENVAEQHPAPFLIYQESNAVIHAVRDYA